MGKTLYRETEMRVAEAFSNAIAPNKRAILHPAKLWALRRFYAGTRAYFEANPNAVAVAWNGLNTMRQIFMRAAQDAGSRTLFFERAPFADRITADPRGVNYENSLPRQAAPYLTWAKTKCRDPEAWLKLRDTIAQRKPITKYGHDVPVPPMDGPFIFVPLQVPGDSQLRVFGGMFRTIDVFVAAILRHAENCPAGWHIRIKEHPSSVPFVGAAIRASGVQNVVLDNSTNTFDQVRQSKLVLTVNSSVGLEAMFFDKPVVAAGNCFWAIEGIANSAQTPEALAKLFSDPNQVTFDPDARHAFFSFLDQEYYPRLSAPLALPIMDRLKGPDALGFWENARLPD